MRFPSLRRAALAVSALSLVLAGGCTSHPEAATIKTRDKVTFLTGFGAYGRDAYAWVARAKGFMAAQNIDLDIQLGAAGAENMKALKANQVQFTALDFSGAIVQHGTGQADWFRAVLAVHQQTLVSVMSTDDRRITTPKDLEGKRIVHQAGSVNKTLFPMYAKLAGIDAGKVTWIDAQAPQLPTLFASHQADAVGQFLVGAPSIEAVSAGHKAVVLPYSEYMADLYGNAIIGDKSFIDAHQDLTRRFVTAMLAGLDYTIKNPDEAGELLHTAVAATSATVAAGEVKLMAPYVRSGESTALGGFDRTKVARSIAVLQAGGLFPQGFDPQDVVDFDIAPKS